MGRAPSDLVVLATPGGEWLAERLPPALGGIRGVATIRRFPDGETYVRVETPITGRDVVLAASLRDPDATLTALVLLAATARDLGARRVGLVAPYLPYLRQDARFAPGEGITSRYVGRWLSQVVDWLVTVDPHLHRHAHLGEVYEIPATALTAAPAIAGWLAAHVAAPLLIGPDAESAQWAGAVGAAAGAPCIVLEKRRRGDRAVEIVVPDVHRWRAHTPVLVDDIISTAHTMSETVRGLRATGMPPPVCIGVHAVFADGAEAALASAGAARVVTCDTIPHPTNAIPTLDLLTLGVRRHL